MSATLIRKCAFCGEDIVLTKNDMHMVSYKQKSYHTECFKTMCNGRVLKNNRYSFIYSDALQNLDQLESEAQKKLMLLWPRLPVIHTDIYLLAKIDIVVKWCRQILMHYLILLILLVAKVNVFCL